MSRHVCHLSSVHSAQDVRIFHKEARTLAQAGYDVVVIARHQRDEVIDGVRVTGLPQPTSRLKRFVFSTCSALKLAGHERADTYHIHDAELIPAGLLLKLWRRRVIYDVHEDLPRQICGKPWVPAWLKRPVAGAVEILEKIAVHSFDHLVAATPAIAARFPAHKVALVQNYPILGELSCPKPKPFEERSLAIAFVGGISAARGVWEMVQAMALLPSEMQAELILAGSFQPPQLRHQLEHLPGWRRTKPVGWLSRGQVRELLGQIRAGLVLFHPLPNHIEAQPNKLFEYMSAGIPVIASDFPLWRAIVRGNDCGLVVDPLSAEAIAEAIRWLLEHPIEAELMGKRGHAAVTTYYNWSVEAQKLLALYAELA